MRANCSVRIGWSKQKDLTEKNSQFSNSANELHEMTIFEEDIPILHDEHEGPRYSLSSVSDSAVEPKILFGRNIFLTG